MRNREQGLNKRKNNQVLRVKKYYIENKIENMLGSTLIKFIDPVYYILRYIHFNIFFHNTKKDIKNEKIDILFSSLLLNWRERKDKFGKKYEDDIMIGDVMRKSKERFYVKGIDQEEVANKIFRPYKKTQRKYRKTDDWICAEQFIDMSSIFKAFFLSINSSFRYRTDKNFDYYFSALSKSVKLRYLLDLIIAKKILSQVKPKVLFLTCEYSPLNRALAYMARTEGIPTIALQHGIITPVHPDYIFDDNNMKLVLPNITLVYGRYHYNLLTKNSVYEPKQVIVTGNPRYDVLYHADKIYSREEFLKKYNIRPDSKIILWITQCHDLSEEENIKNFVAVFGTMQNLKDKILIIKQHPGEEEKHTKMIEANLKKYKIDVVITPKSSDTYEQLYVCDLMMTKNSTVAMEAVALNKPVIVLNLSGERDVVDYVEQGVALGVYREEDLRTAIEKLLKDESDLSKNRKRYIEKYLYKIDGKATERVAGVIKTMIDRF